MDTFQRREHIKSAFHNEIQKIINVEKLVQRLDSMDNIEQIEDVLAEIEVALSYIQKGLSVEYEPDVTPFGFVNSKTPEFLIKNDKTEFYVEVKRSLETKNTRKGKEVKEDINVASRNPLLSNSG
jgi:hypothetical protein